MMHSDESSDDERGRDGGSSNSETDDKSSDDEGAADRIEEIDLSNASFCSIHKPGEMTRDCATCSAALAAIKPEIADQLLASGPSSDILSKYSMGRCDEVHPHSHSVTMSLDWPRISSRVAPSGTRKPSRR